MGINYTSDVFYHFVGREHPMDHEANYEILLKILSSGHVTHRPHRPWVHGEYSFDWDVDVDSGELMIPEITCYCDIPFESLGIHIQKYGAFGISFGKEFLIKMGARPVTYVPLQLRSEEKWARGTLHRTTLGRDWQNIWNGFYKHLILPAEQESNIHYSDVEPASARDAVFAMEKLVVHDFFAFLKVFDSSLADDVPENYYMERE
jgi:Putative abortive phage resistance protein AbiGi, antitoxin